MAKKEEAPKAGGRLNTGSIITNCDCVSAFQDEKYGRQQRVMNGCRGGYSCTICSKKKTM